MQSSFNVYTRNPFPNAPEFRHIKSLHQGSQIEDETETSRRVRRRLYQKREGVAVTTRTRQLTKAQKQKIARDQVLATLMDPTVVDPTRITDVLSEWATNDLGIDEAVSNRIFATALVTTETVPSKNIFRIRVKI